MRLTDSGQFVGFVYEYEPERFEFAGTGENREPGASVEARGEVGGFSVVPDEGVSPSPGNDVPGLEAEDRHRCRPPMLRLV
ncbi:MAG: hypothetical protein KGL39_33760 [Patescibacteria group bacterium]|nr:hypothetical protein [Patescibacteria group bacterium]